MNSETSRIKETFEWRLRTSLEDEFDRIIIGQSGYKGHSLAQIFLTDFNYIKLLNASAKFYQKYFFDKIKKMDNPADAFGILAMVISDAIAKTIVELIDEFRNIKYRSLSEHEASAAMSLGAIDLNEIIERKSIAFLMNRALFTLRFMDVIANENKTEAEKLKLEINKLIEKDRKRNHQVGKEWRDILLYPLAYEEYKTNKYLDKTKALNIAFEKIPDKEKYRNDFDTNKKSIYEIFRKYEPKN